MNRAIIIGIVGVLLAGSGSLITAWWMSRPVVHPEPVDVTFDSLSNQLGPVRLSGTAHYVALVKQDVEATLFQEAKTVYSFGLFPKGEVSSKEIRVLIRTDEPIPKNIDFGYMTYTGYLEQPTRATVPFQMERILGEKTGYFFSPDLLVLRPWHQEAIDLDQGS
tara:strand:- start:40 stop:531 length:492 start_codon:yes stop_codon:yes gene_type:complete